MRPKKTLSLLNEFITSDNRSMIFYKKPKLSTNSSRINIGCRTSFRWETRSGCICRKRLYYHPLYYGPYTITKDLVDNDFELSIPPFLGLHPMFNVDPLQPYFPPLLDTSKIAEYLISTYLNPGYMEQETINHIRDTYIKGS
jgi:hypothetical protein